MKSKLNWIALFMLFFIQINGQDKLETLDSFIKHSLDKFTEIPGLTITVVKGKQAVFTKAYGFLDVENRIASTTSSPYYIASVTKSFVGLLACVLEEEGLFKLEDPITMYKPIKNFKDPSIFNNITIRDLLSHTMGIENWALNYRFSYGGQYTMDHMVQILEKETVSLYNDKTFSYDNFGYNILDLILHEEFGKSWKKLLQQKIFLPLQMNKTSPFMSDVDKMNWNLAKPYCAIGDARRPIPAHSKKNDATMQSAGGLVTTVEDINNWLIMNMHSGMIKGKRIFSEKVVTKAHTKITEKGSKSDMFKTDGYTLGWNSGFFRDRESVHHFGGFDGYFSHVSFLPKEQLGIAVFANESYFGDNISNLIASFAYDLFLGEVTSIEEYSEEIKKLVNKVNRTQEVYKEDRNRRKDRKWRLSKDKNKYQGDFVNVNMGTLKVRYDDSIFTASLGVSMSKGTPSNSNDAIRVEFKTNLGRDLRFIFYKEDAIAIMYRGSVFYRKQSSSI